MRILHQVRLIVEHIVADLFGSIRKISHNRIVTGRRQKELEGG